MHHPRRMNKYERMNAQQDRLAQSLAGTGKYIYQNNTKGSLDLPKPTSTGKKNIQPDEKFESDSYFLQWVKPPLNLLRLVETIPAIKPEVKTEVVGNAVKMNEILQKINEEISMEDKLILDQPDTVTQKGTVEHVVAKSNEHVVKSKSKKNLNDSVTNSRNKQDPDVLLNESPLDGFEIIS